MKKLGLLVLGTIMALLIAEFVLRTVGYQPYVRNTVVFSCNPESYFIADSLLGYAAKPGQYNLNFNNLIHTTITHWSDHTRATSNRPTVGKKPKIFIYGCSFTHGFNLNDDETAAWLLQYSIDSIDVRNFGLSGYGLSQIYYQIKHHLAKKNLPRLLIINYASFHDYRNVGLRQYRKAFIAYSNNDSLDMDGMTFPVFSLDNRNNLVPGFKNLVPSVFFQEYSALINQVDMVYSLHERSELYMQKVSMKLLLEINGMAKNAGVELLVTGIVPDQKTKQMLEFCALNKIRVLDISVDMSNEKYCLKDGHPSALANQHFAKKLYEYLCANPSILAHS